MKNPKNEFAPFGLPGPSDDDSLDYISEDGGGPSATEEKQTVITDPRKYQESLGIVTEILGDRERSTWQPSFYVDIQGVDDTVNPQRYIDTLIVARRAYHVPHYKKRGEWIRKPSFYVHAYAVSDILDDRGRRPPRTKEEIVGYYLTAGSAEHTFGLFIRTQDRAFLKELHDRVMHACANTPQPKGPEMALREIYDFYQNIPQKDNRSDIEFVWKGGIPRSQIPGLNLLAISQTMYKQEDTESEELKMIERKTYDRERKMRMRVAALRDQSGQEAPPADYCPRGYLQPRRTGDQREYIDEIISGLHDGTYLHTQAIDIGRKRLTKPEDANAYKITFGVEPFTRRLLIYTSDRSAAERIHREIIARMQQAYQDPEYAPERVLWEIAEEYNSGHDLPFIRVLSFES